MTHTTAPESEDGANEGAILRPCAEVPCEWWSVTKR